MHTNTKQIGLLGRSAQVAANSYDEAANTIEVVFATDTPVVRNTWDGNYNEVLSMDASHMRMERINSGAPVLNNHRSYGGVDTQLGKVERAWIEGGVAKAILRFSKRADIQPIIQDIRDGIISSVSVGYRVHKYEEKAAPEPKASPNGNSRADTTPTYIATDWEPYEISMVSIPADTKAGVRADGDTQNDVIIISQDIERKMDTPTPNPAPVVATEEQIRAAQETATKAERQRVADIQLAARQAGLGDEFASQHITDGTTVDGFRAAAFEELAKRSPKVKTHNSQTHVTADESDKVRAGMSEAIEGRAAGNYADRNKNQYLSMSLLRMAAECVERAGGNTKNLTDAEIARAALNLDRYRAGMHSTSDFPIILGNTIDRKLKGAYNLQAQTFRPFTTRRTVRDFREITDVQMSELGALDKIVEGGEYKFATLSESKEVYRLAKYGKRIAVTWEMLINDDLGAFNRIPTLLANQVAQLQSKVVYDVLLNNANMGDGNALFSTAHSNIAASGTTITEASLEAMFIAMRNQKDLNGTDLINVTPAFLLVGPAREVLARKFMSASYQPTVAGDINVFAQSMQIIVDPRITGNKWFGMANPNQIDTIETAVLEGEGEIYTEQREGFDVDGVEVKIRSTFAAKAKDWRGMYYNAGN
jgi:hypothetical protein